MVLALDRAGIVWLCVRRDFDRDRVLHVQRGHVLYIRAQKTKDYCPPNSVDPTILSCNFCIVSYCYCKIVLLPPWSLYDTVLLAEEVSPHIQLAGPLYELDVL